MEESNILMKDFPLFRSRRSGLWGLAAMVLPLALLAVVPAGMPLALVLILMALPAACCTVGLVSGLLPMLAGAITGVLVMYRIAGITGAQLAAVYLLPVLVVFLLVINRRTPFWKGCAFLIGTHAAALTAVFLLLQAIAGGQLFVTIGDRVVDLLSAIEDGDLFLYAAYQYGLIDLTEAMRETMLITLPEGGTALNPAARADLLLSMRSLVNQLSAVLIPSILVTQSILGGVACLALPLRFGSAAAQKRDFKQVLDENKELQAPDFPDLRMPPFEVWHIPRGIGWKVGVSWLLGNLLQASSSTPVAIAGILLYSAATALFTVQGLCCIYALQKAKSVKLVWRILVPILLYLFSALALMGIFDQITNIRGLRAPRKPKEE